MREKVEEFSIKFSWLWGLIDGNSFGLRRWRELSELSNSFLVQNPKSLNSFQLFSENFLENIRRSSGTNTLKFKHRILEKNKLICLDDDKLWIEYFLSLVFFFNFSVIGEVTRFR
jgi:hypothetical protein